MMPQIAARRGALTNEFTTIRQAAILAFEATEALALETVDSRRSAWYRLATERLAEALDNPSATRRQLLEASPAVVELSGRDRTLLEMIEDDPGDDHARLRLAKILLRALSWRAEPGLTLSTKLTT